MLFYVDRHHPTVSEGSVSQTRESRLLANAVLIVEIDSYMTPPSTPTHSNAMLWRRSNRLTTDWLINSIHPIQGVLVKPEKNTNGPRSGLDWSGCVISSTLIVVVVVVWTNNMIINTVFMIQRKREIERHYLSSNS